VTSEDATALFHLRCLLHGAYAINANDGIWVARRCDNPTHILTADTARNCAGCCTPTTASNCGPGPEATEPPLGHLQRGHHRLDPAPPPSSASPTATGHTAPNPAGLVFGLA
jgi:hypothetical protein